jgi:hypothetical protein
MNNTACAHLRIKYIRINHQNNTASDSWECEDCGILFAPVTLRDYDMGHAAGVAEERERCLRIVRNEYFESSEVVNADLTKTSTSVILPEQPIPIVDVLAEALNDCVQSMVIAKRQRINFGCWAKSEASLARYEAEQPKAAPVCQAFGRVEDDLRHKLIGQGSEHPHSHEFEPQSERNGGGGSDGDTKYELE